MNRERLVKTLICFICSPLVPIYLVGGCLQRLLFRHVQQSKEVALSYSQVIWDDVWQRPQEHAWRTSTSRFVIYCAPVQLHNWFWNLGWRYRQVQVKRRENGLLVILSPLVFCGHFKARWIYDLNSLIIYLHIRLWLGSRKHLYLLANTPLAYGPVQHLRRGARTGQIRRIVYDVIDDFTAFRWFPAFAQSYHSRMQQLADGILTGTHQLAKSHHGSTFVPCGVDFAAFSTPAATPADIAALPKPIIGYFGTISERIDLDLIAGVCDAMPTASVVMIGPVHFESAQLPQKPNLHYLGLKPHSEIPAYAQSFGVGLIPFRLTEATRQLHPVKTLEYLAAGVPVVSTGLPEIQHFYSGVVDIADSHKDFIKKVSLRILEPDPTRTSTGIEKARNASWEAMTERMNLLLFTAQTSHPGSSFSNKESRNQDVVEPA